jgi:UPF0271 protein
MIRKEKYEKKFNEDDKTIPFGKGLEWIIDLNCDMGEGMGNEALIMPYISSANLACGYHAGNESIIRQTVELCIKYNVAIGAHPSFLDKENFGRTEMQLPVSQVYDMVAKQIHFLNEIVIRSGAILHHVKPHGALYNMSARDPQLASTIAKAVKDIDEKLILFGLSGSNSIIKAKEVGLKTANEVFADRTYQDDGSLTPRSEKNALIEDTDKATEQAVRMIKEKTVTSLSGKLISISTDTICIHGDGKKAGEFVKQIHDTLNKEQIKIQSIKN